MAPDKKNIIKVNPLSFGVGTFSMAYERIINEKFTAQVGLALLNTDFFLGQGDDTRNILYQGQVYTLEGRYYPQSGDYMKAPNGLYLAPFIRIHNISDFRYAQQGSSAATRREMDGSLFSVGLGGMVGYQIIAAKRITFEAFAGPYYSFPNFEPSSAQSDESLEDDYNILFYEFDLRAGVTLGFRF